MRGLESAGSSGYLRLSEQQLGEIVSNEPIQKYFSVDEEPFARGKYAAVKRCRELNSGREFAAKSLKKKSRGPTGREEILHEVAVLDACRSCPQIVSLHRVFESSQEIVLILELARGGELQTLLDSDEELPSERQVQELMRQILDGILFLHGINVAHLDIKPQNLILMGEFPSCEVKLCDFGISRYLSQGADVREILGTPDYVAPEVLNYEPISLATDMWSVGVLLYVLLSGCSPFGGDTKQETFCNISQCRLDFPDDLFSDISDEAKDLITKLIVKNPSGRLTAEQCKNHPWFSMTFSELATPLSSPMPSTKSRTPVPLKRSIIIPEMEKVEVKPTAIRGTCNVTEQKTGEEKSQLDEIDSLNNNNVKPKGLSEERKKSLQTNLASLVERLEPEPMVTRSPRLQRTDSLKRASAMQTMPAFRFHKKSSTDLEQTVYKFQRVVIVDEDEGLPPSPPSSSADNSSISDTSSDTISEMSIDSSSDRSSIISLDESLDYHHHPYGGRLRHYSSCLNIWDGQRQRSPSSTRPFAKECNQSFVLAMSKFRNGENILNNNSTEQAKVRLRSPEDRSRFHVFNSNRLSLPLPPPGRKSIGLEFVRENNGNLVTIREVKAIQGKKYSRTSELKCETVQSRIRKLQQIKSDQLANNVF